jgi:predicted Rdx family selenoprotein
MTRRQFAQELLSTFGTALGEVALQPSTGGTFIVSLYVSVPLNEGDIRVQHHVLWDRKAEGGFPGTSFSANPSCLWQESHSHGWSTLSWNIFSTRFCLNQAGSTIL